MLLAGLTTLIVQPVFGQATLPDFTLERLNMDKVLVHWKNPDTSLRQLSIQQSADSLNGFKTILTVLKPQLEQNGSVISRPQASKMFYRIYLLYPLGRYVFTPSKFPTETSATAKKNLTALQNEIQIDSSTRNNPTGSELDPAEKKNKKKPEPAPEPVKWVPSPYLYTQTDGFPFIKLPAEWELDQIQIRFFQENGDPLFVLNDPPIRIFRIDKTNFHRAGWYKFEIWFKGKLTDSNRFYLPLEF